IAELVRSITPGPAIEIGTAPDPLEDIQARFSIDAAHRDLGYTPAVALDDGIRSYAARLSATSGHSH
ncbi:MAG: NAD-dependent epimerase/dehydratase family protein, partial [Bradyrhizobium sp.]